MIDRDRTIAYAKLVAAVVFWGASFIATKVALRDVSPLTVMWLRFGIGALLLGAVALGRRQLTLPSPRDATALALLGLLGITFHQWLQVNALLTSRASTTAFLVSTTPIFIAALGGLALKERLRWLAWAGVALATVGVLLVVSDGDLASLAQGFGAPGDVFILISALNWAVFTVLSRWMMQGSVSSGRRPGTWLIFWVMTSGWLLTTVFFLAGPGPADVGKLTAGGWLGIAFLGLLCTGLAYVFWYDALDTLPASQVGAFLYLEPPVAVVVAAIVLGEPITLVSLLGGGVILLGVWMVTRPQPPTRIPGR